MKTSGNYLRHFKLVANMQLFTVKFKFIILFSVKLVANMQLFTVKFKFIILFSVKTDYKFLSLVTTHFKCLVRIHCWHVFNFSKTLVETLEIRSKVTIKTLERRHFGVLIVNFKYISHLFVVCLLLNLSKCLFAGL